MINQEGGKHFDFVPSRLQPGGQVTNGDSLGNGTSPPTSQATQILFDVSNRMAPTSI